MLKKVETPLRLFSIIREMKTDIYARVSTRLQNPARQIEFLREYAAANSHEVVGVFSDTCTGGTMDRPGLRALLDGIRGVDAVLVESVDRLGRSQQGVLEAVRAMDAAGVAVVFVRHGIDTRRDPATAAVAIPLFAAFAESELVWARERAAERVALARAARKTVGRPSKTAIAEPERSVVIARWRESGGTLRELAKLLGGVSVATAHKWAAADALEELP